MLPLLALVSSGVCLVDGVGSVDVVEQLGLFVGPVGSDFDLTTEEPHFLLPIENDSGNLAGSKALDDFRIEHDTTVGRLLRPSEASSTDHTMESADSQVFPDWPEAPGITYGEFESWLGGVDQIISQTSCYLLRQPPAMNINYIMPDGIAGRPVYGDIDGHLTHWLNDRIGEAYQSALDTGAPDGCKAEPHSPQIDALSREERWQNFSGVAELLRGGMVIVGLSEPHDASRQRHRSIAAAGEKGGSRVCVGSYPKPSTRGWSYAASNQNETGVLQR